MGREAVCECDWAGTTARVKVLLESTDLIVRGDIRKRVLLKTLKNIEARSGCFRFSANGDKVQIFLGEPLAEKWAKAILSHPPSLASKLGITKQSTVRTIGDIRDESLKEALSEAAQISAKNSDLIVACVDTPESLAAALRSAKPQLSRSIPIWLIYPKGPGHPLSETAIRSVLRAVGMMDTKVASVSSALTALRFNLQK
ncbi:MAG TPA: hypothetical protein VFW25_15705 [Silvibacterium sp.]|nr:hypothetical protein [Silvibacterium sp.]